MRSKIALSHRPCILFYFFYGIGLFTLHFIKQLSLLQNVSFIIAVKQNSTRMAGQMSLHSNFLSTPLIMTDH